MGKVKFQKPKVKSDITKQDQSDSEIDHIQQDIPSDAGDQKYEDTNTKEPIDSKPTLKITKQGRNYKINFNPIRINDNLNNPLAPINFTLKDEWTSDEDNRSDNNSDDSELDIEYVAPGAYITQKRKEPLLFVKKQQYNGAEIDKILEEMEEAKKKEEKKHIEHV